jgi:hypothetical protein
MGLLLSILGIVIFVLVPKAILDTKLSLAFFYLLAIYLSCTFAACMVCQYLINPLSTYFVHTNCWV